MVAGVDLNYRPWGYEPYGYNCIDFDNSLSSQELKVLYYEVANKQPREKKPKLIVSTQDHISEQTYSALDEMRKEEETEKLKIRENLQEGFSPLLKDKGGDYVPLHVINNPRINIEIYLSEKKKGKKEKARKSSWNI